MNIDEAGRALVYRNAEAEKLKLSGSMVITLTYQDGGITKASFQLNCPLIPGARQPSRFQEGVDRPGLNRG